MPNEDASRDGVGFYRWNGRTFHSVGFIPRSTFCGVPPPPLPPERIRYTGSYVNTDYGYTVDVPRYHSGEGAAPGEPNHGFSVSLSVISRLWVEAHSVSEGEPLRLKVNTRLGGLPAELKVWTDEERTLHRRVRAVGSHRRMSILYTLELATKPSRAAQDRPEFEALVRSFRTIPATP